MKKGTVLIGLLTLLMLLTGTFALRPISTITLEDTERVQGTLVSLDKDKETGDILFKLADHKSHYYINRGLDKGLNLSSLETKNENKKIDIYYAKHWTPLDPFGKIKHVARIVYDNSVVYDEISN